MKHQMIVATCLCCTGAAAVPDHRAAPRPDDGGTQWGGQDNGLEGAAQGPGEAGGSGGRRSRHRPQGRNMLDWSFTTFLTSHTGASYQAYALIKFRFFMTNITMFYY